MKRLSSKHSSKHSPSNSSLRRLPSSESGSTRSATTQGATQDSGVLSRIAIVITATPTRPLLVSFAVATVLMAVTLLLATPQFNTRDDTIMMLLSSGAIIALQPSPYLMYTHVWIGNALAWLYSIAPEGYWYAWYLLGALWLAFWFLCYSALAALRSWLALVLYGLWFLASGSFMLFSLQFSMVAQILAVAGVALSCTALLQQRSLSWLIAAACMLLLAWMIRWKSALLGVACFAPIPLVLALQPVLQLLLLPSAQMQSRLRSFQAIAEQCLPVIRALLAVILVGVCWLVLREIHNTAHNVAYNTARGAAQNAAQNAASSTPYHTSDVIAFNELCERILDERPFQRSVASHEAVRDVLQQAGWSEYDLEMFSNDFYLNDTLYNASALNKLLRGLHEREEQARTSTNPAIQAQVRSLEQRFSATFWNRQWAIVRNYLVLPLVWTCLLVLAWHLLGWTTVQSTLAALATVGALVGAMTYVNHLSLMRDLPERVLYPLSSSLYCVPMIAPILTFTPARRRVPLNKGRLVGAIALIAAATIAVSVFALPGTVAQARAITIAADEAQKTFQQHLQALQPDSTNLYVIWGAGFPMHGIVPFHKNLADDTRQFRAVWLSWAERMPTTVTMMHSFGVQDLYWSLATDSCVYALLNVNQVREKTLMYQLRYEIYLNQHYGASVKGAGDAFRILTPNQQGVEPNPYATYLQAKFRLQRVDTALMHIHTVE